MIKKLKEWILPKEIDFFKSLREQSLLTSNIIDKLSRFYVNDASRDPQHILDLIDEAKKNSSASLKDLNATFITPVDKESISRAYAHLYWVALSIKHLVVEIDTYKIYNLSEYERMFQLLSEEMYQLTEGFRLLDTRQFEDVLKNIDQIIHLDNDLMKNYAAHLVKLFQKSDFTHIFMHREILSQLKEISKRIHICANLLEDIIFKIN